MKRIVSLILALMLVASLSVTAFADDTTPATGSITINGVGEGTTYEIYKMLDLESYDVAAGAYAYTVNSAWQTFFTVGTPTGDGTHALDYMAIDADGYVTWIAAEDDDTKANFAKLALAHAKATSTITPEKTSLNTGDFVVTGTAGKFSGLPLGYYLIDSTMGALCGLTTTNPDAFINAKNGIPTIEKQVLEDSTAQWGTHNTADIGQTVEYRVTINVHAGAENYVLHDCMEEGLTFTGITKVEHVIPGKETHDATGKYAIVTPCGKNGCNLEIAFTPEFCNKLETNDKIVVYYTAMLNRDADIATEDDGNVNTACLTFGEGGTSNTSSVTTYTYGIDIVKTDSANKLIDGAQFKIYSDPNLYEIEVDGKKVSTEVGVVPLMEKDEITPVLDSNGNPMYRRARPDEQEAGKTVPIVVTDGQITVVGFDNGTYYLEETEAPDGYNKLTARQRFIISDGSLNATFNDGIFSTGSGVHVVNKTGSMLPETGATGTMLFISFGMFVMLATGVLLVTKKRMTMIQD